MIFDHVSWCSSISCRKSSHVMPNRLHKTFWIFVEKFCSKLFGSTLQEMYNKQNNVSFSPQTMKRFSLFKASTSIGIWLWWSRFIVIGCMTYLKVENYFVNNCLWKRFVSELWSRLSIVDERVGMAMTSWRMEFVTLTDDLSCSCKFYINLLVYQLVSIVDIKINMFSIWI